MQEDINQRKLVDHLYKQIQRLTGLIILLVIGIIAFAVMSIYSVHFSWGEKVDTQAIEINQKANLEWDKEKAAKKELETYWSAADIYKVKDETLYKKLQYGRELISHTAKYFGPRGSVRKISNGLNCQNCHLDAGNKIWGNNYGAVFSTYPKYRARSGQIEDIYKRVNDCFERSLNGQPLDNNSPEMQAIKAYIEFVGKDVPKGEKPKGSGIFALPFLDRAIDPIQGAKIYAAKCQSCHQANGQGILAADSVEYTCPPLWGANSYNIGAGLYRMSRFAGYIKYNMPQGVNFPESQLT
ncbi:MAG: hypothetical protein KA797_07430, partial [Chitinophagales bacterium]|nr:hypothetical protein [Chitinophagales bacterium]